MKSRLIPIFLLMVSNAATGTIIETRDFLPFGSAWSRTGGSEAQTLTDPDNRWRYSGKEEQQALHQDLPLIDYGARMYDPTVARWMSPRPARGEVLPDDSVRLLRRESDKDSGFERFGNTRF